MLSQIEALKNNIELQGQLSGGVSLVEKTKGDLRRLEAEHSYLHLRNSVGGRVGQALEPLFRPLGYDWKLTIGILASLAAREVFVSTMSVVYNVGEVDDAEIGSTSGLVDRMRREKRSDGTPMYTPALGITLMVFYVFAMQCISTIAIVKRETGSWKWALVQLGYMTGTAYVLSLLIYQVGTGFGY